MKNIHIFMILFKDLLFFFPYKIKNYKIYSESITTNLKNKYYQHVLIFGKLKKRIYSKKDKPIIPKYTLFNF